MRRKSSRKFVDLFWENLRRFFPKKHFRQNISLSKQIRLRRLRKLGVSSSNEKSDESGNQKTAKSDESSNNNNSLSNTSPSNTTADKDDNKNVIPSGKVGW